MKNLLLLLCLGVLADAVSQWEPCNIQCRKNYQSSDLSQRALISVCENGCKIFNAALVSTIPEFPTVISISNELNIETKIQKNRDEDKPKGPQVVVAAKLSRSNKKHRDAPSESNAINLPGVTKTETKNRKLESPSTKVAESYTSQPVQDHPVDSGKETSTTNKPKDVSKTENSKEKTIEVKQTNAAKHIEKHSPDHLQPSKKKNDDLILIKEEQAKPHESVIRIQLSKQPLKMNERLKQSSKMNERLKQSSKMNERLKQSSKMNERLELAKHICRQECMRSYKITREQQACLVGCNLQATTASLKPSNPMTKMGQTEPRSQFGQFQRNLFGFAGDVGQFFRVVWSSVASRLRKGPTQDVVSVFETNEVQNRGAEVDSPIMIGLRSSPIIIEPEQNKMEKMMFEQSNLMDFLKKEIFLSSQRFSSDESFSSIRYSGHNMPRIIAVLKKESSVKHVLKKEQSSSHHHNDKTQQHHQLIPQHKPMPKISPKPHHEEFGFGLDLSFDSDIKKFMEQVDKDDAPEPDDQLDLLECISRKSGLPKWFIAITIFSSAIIVLWLCFSLTTPSDDVKSMKTKAPVLQIVTDGEDDDYDDRDEKKLISGKHYQIV